MKLRYQFANGETNEVEVSDEIAAVITELDERKAKSDRRETRRHSSIDDLMEQGIQFADYLDIAEIASQADAIKKLYTAMEHLLPQQKELLHKVFFEERSIASIAKEEGVTKQALNDRLNKIYRRLKKYLT